MLLYIRMVNKRNTQILPHFCSASCRGEFLPVEDENSVIRKEGFESGFNKQSRMYYVELHIIYLVEKRVIYNERLTAVTVRTGNKIHSLADKRKVPCELFITKKSDKSRITTTYKSLREEMRERKKRRN